MDKWYEKPACNIGTVICGQVCVIRNAAGYPFAHRMNAQQKQELVQAAARAIAQSDKLSALQMEFYDLRDYTDTMKERMISRLIIPPFMIEEGSPVQVFVTPDESISIILGGSEHICIQVSTPGKTVLEAYNTANMIVIQAPACLFPICCICRIWRGSRKQPNIHGSWDSWAFY